METSARPRLPAWVQPATKNLHVLALVVACQPLIGLAPSAQGAILSILSTLSTLKTLTQSILSIITILSTLKTLRTLMTLIQLRGLGQAGAGGEDAARAVVGEAPGQGREGAPCPQMGANHVTDQRMREKPVSQNLA